MATSVKQMHYAPRIVKRSDGHSAVAASAYRARIQLVDERTGDVHNYKHGKNDVLFEGVFTPDYAPSWMRDRHQLWNAVEKYEKRKDSQVAKDLIVSLSASLTTEQNTRVLKDFIRDNFTRKGFIVDVAMHKPDRRGDQRNIHAHMQISIRSLNKDGSWSGKEQFVKGQPPKNDLMDLKARFTKRLNEELAKHGIDERWEYTSLEAQGIKRAPEQHLGKDAANLERDTAQSDRADNLRLVREAHRLRREADKIEREYANANTAARDRANDDAPQIEQPTLPPQAAPQPTAAQSAVDRMSAEERAAQIETLRSLGRSRWTTMGDELRGIFTAVRNLATTMGGALFDIVKGGGFFQAKAEVDSKKAMQKKAQTKAPEPVRAAPKPTQPTPATATVSPLDTLRKMGEEQRAKNKRRAEQDAADALRRSLGDKGPKKDGGPSL